MLKKLLSVVVVGAVSLSVLAGATGTTVADGIGKQAVAVTYALQGQSSKTHVELSTSYKGFSDNVSGSLESGYSFHYDQGDTKGNLVKVRTYSLDDYERFDDFIGDLATDLVGESNENILAEGVISQDGKNGYTWIYQNESIEYIGHVARVFPVGTDALLVFGTAENDLNHLEDIVATFKFDATIVE